MTIRKLGFCGGAMTLRGVHIAIFDYAFHNQQILGNQSIVFYDGQSKNNEPSVIERFQKHFYLIPYQNKDLNKVSEKSANQVK